MDLLGVLLDLGAGLLMQWRSLLVFVGLRAFAACHVQAAVGLAARFVQAVVDFVACLDQAAVGFLDCWALVVPSLVLFAWHRKCRQTCQYFLQLFLLYF